MMAENNSDKMDAAAATQTSNGMTTVTTPVDEKCSIASKVHVYDDGKDGYDAMLNQTNIGNNNNKFYIIQLLESDASPRQYWVWTRWGRVGSVGQNALQSMQNLDMAKKFFCSKFTDKTRNQWENRANFQAHRGVYTMVQRDHSNNDEHSDASDSTASTNPATSTPTQLPPRPTCVSLLGPPPVVDSRPALLSLACDLHTLTTLLPATVHRHQVSSMESSVLSTLSRMDEMSALLDAIKHSTQHAESVIMPAIKQRQDTVQQIIQQAHTWAKLVEQTERAVTHAEKRVMAVENALAKTDRMQREQEKLEADAIEAEKRAAEQTVKKLFASFRSLGSKSSSTPERHSLPPLIDLVDSWEPFSPVAHIHLSEYFDVKTPTDEQDDEHTVAVAVADVPHQ